VNKKRPVNLDLVTIRFPITAISSILHRISGVILFFCIPIMLYFLQCSLKEPASFDALHSAFQSFPLKLLNFLIISALIYHFIAGIRHLLMDCGIGENKTSGKVGAKIAIIVSVISIIVWGAWLWIM